MSFFQVFDVSGSALSAENVRLNTTASNLANAQSVSGRPEDAYRARQPVFAAVMAGVAGEPPTPGVRVAGIVEDGAPPVQRYEPEHPMADEQGYIYLSNVNTVEEMANMISASRAYQNNVKVMETAKQLLLTTLRLGE